MSLFLLRAPLTSSPLLFFRALINNLLWSRHIAAMYSSGTQQALLAISLLLRVPSPTENVHQLKRRFHVDLRYDLSSLVQNDVIWQSPNRKN